MTIALCDVCLSINGPPIYLENCYHDHLGLFNELLGIFLRNDVKSKSDVSMNWFRKAFQDQLKEDVTDIETLQHIRTIILYILNSLIFTDDSKG